jgi:pyruvate dehydrogenase E1 component beta subunit
MRVLNPISPKAIIESVAKTGRLVAVDGGWSPAGFAGEIIAAVTESTNPKLLKSSPRRVTLPFAPAPSSPVLEKIYYPTPEDVVKVSLATFSD